MSRLVLPKELSRETLASIVSKVQGRMYLDLDGHGTKFWNPGKEWSCSDVCQDIQGALHKYGLVPGDEQAYEEAVSDPQLNSVGSLVGWAESNGLKPEDLDDLIHDCASATASEINNQGLGVQIEYLVDQLGEPEAVAQLTRMAPSAASPPDGRLKGETVRIVKYVLYDHDVGHLAATTVYESFDEAQDDAAELDDVIVVPLVFETD